MKRVIIDCDPGIDDTAAILLALASPELEVIAVTTTYGNASVETCTANALRVLAAAGRSDIPVFMGAGKPLLRPANEGWAAHIHGGDGLGGVIGDVSNAPSSHLPDKHATLAIVEAVMAAPGELTVLALGRMTNVALALSLEPRVADTVQEIVVMGGAVTVPGQRLRGGNGQPARRPGSGGHRLPFRRAHRAGGAGRVQPGHRQPGAVGGDCGGRLSGDATAVRGHRLPAGFIHPH